MPPQLLRRGVAPRRRHRLIRPRSGARLTAPTGRRDAGTGHGLRRLRLRRHARSCAPWPRRAGASGWRCAAPTLGLRAAADGRRRPDRAGPGQSPQRRPRSSARSTAPTAVRQPGRRALRDGPPALRGRARRWARADVAEAAAARGITRFVQMSALGADADSPSKYARTKAAGEAAVRARDPDRRPSCGPRSCSGPRTSFFNKFAAMAAMSPALPLIGGGETRFQPVYRRRRGRGDRRGARPSRTRRARPTSWAGPASTASRS